MPTDTPASRMSDFSGRLSPMLVKELRQGLRTNLFVVAFILLQTFMVLCLMAGLADSNSNDADGFFWFFIVATLLFVQPLRGFNALSNEYTLNTLDLIQLTKLNGWRIVFGKWTALNAQSLLFLVGVLPYLVIRYFLGNVDFISDLLALGIIGLGSALGSAYTVGVSVFKSVILRGLLVGGVGFVVLGMGPAMSFGFGRSGLFSGFTWSAFWIVLGIAAYGCFFFLSFGASRIAARSENYAIAKRLVALGTAALCLAVLLSSLDEELAVVYAGIVLGLACIDALTEPLPIYSRVLSRARSSALARPFAFFFTSGWLSGIAFFVLCGAVWWGIFLLTDLATGNHWIDGMEEKIVVVSSFNLIIFPLLIIHAFFPRYASGNFTFGIYVFIQAALAMLTILAGVMSKAFDSGEELVAMFFPIPSVLLMSASGTNLNHSVFLVVSIITTVLCITIPLLRNRAAVMDFIRNLKS